MAIEKDLPNVGNEENQKKITFEDFDPPLKRKTPTVPGYWTIEELSKELGFSIRKVTYHIIGRPEHNIPPFNCRKFNVQNVYLIPDEESFFILTLFLLKKKLISVLI